MFTFVQSYFRVILGNRTCSGYVVIKELEKHPELFSIDYSPFFERIMKSFETKRWVDIKNDYYYMLKKGIYPPLIGNTIEELIRQLDFLRDKLAEYLGTISCAEYIPTIGGAIRDYLYTEDLSTEGKKILSIFKKYSSDGLLPPKHLSIERTILLRFNYTEIAKIYVDDDITLNYIHGELEHS